MIKINIKWNIENSCITEINLKKKNNNNNKIKSLDTFPRIIPEAFCGNKKCSSRILIQ